MPGRSLPGNDNVSRATSAQPARPGPALEAVLGHERAAAALTADAEREAQAILRDATDRADARRAGIDEEVMTAVRALEAEQRECERHEIEKREAELLGELRRIESVDSSVVDVLVEHVLARAIDGGRAR